MSSLNSTTATTTPSGSTTSSLDTTTTPPTTETSSTTTSSTSTTSEVSTTSQLSSTTTVVSSQPPTTVVTTSFFTITPTSGTPSVIIITSAPTAPPASTSTDSSSSTTTTPAALAGSDTSNSGGSGGLSTGATTAIAVVIPVVVVAGLVVLGLFLWRKRKQKKATEEMRRKEIDEYNYNPNNDPTLPAVASESGQGMSEDHSSGYRGWGAATGSNRKMSTTLSGGHTQGQLSDSGSNAYRSANSPNGGNSDAPSGDPLMQQRRETMNSDEIGSLGHAPVAGAGALQPGMKRGPSNASSTYSAGAHSDASDGPPMPAGTSFDAYQPNNGYGYSQHGPYGDGTYGGAKEPGMPVVRDVSARRNTRIQQPGNYQQGNSGISQNF